MNDSDKITIDELLSSTVARFKEKSAIVYSDRGLNYTYKEFDDICNKFAKGLIRLGIKKGEHIAIWATNIPEWIIVQFGCAKIGAVLVTINTSFKLFELEYILSQSDSVTLFMIEGTRSNNYINTIYELCPELKNCSAGKLYSYRLPLLKNVIMIGDKKYPGMFNWNDILKMGDDVSDDELMARKSTVEPDDIAIIMYTSGTTGFPKGVMLTHHNLITNARGTASCMKLGPNDKVCIPVPLYHCFGCVSGTICSVIAGATMVPVEIFEPVKVLKTVEEMRCTVLHGVPTMFIMELEAMKTGSFDTSSLRTGIVAGAECPVEIMRQIEDVLKIKEIVIAYGQTEASPGITNTRTDDPHELRISTVGRALPGVEVKIVDIKTGEELPPGREGEICARGSNIMKGYYKMPEATAAVIDKDGWLHTGDVGVLDENGYLRFICRLKDMIIRGGENIYPREIEEFLRNNPNIKDVQVIGVPSPKYGEEVIAFIIPKDGQSITANDIQKFCEGKIARYKIPKYILFTESFPITPTGKVKKDELKKMAIKLLDSEMTT